MDRDFDITRIREAARAAGLGEALSRRGFLLLSASTAAAITAMGLCEALGADAPLVILDSAKGMILADPTRCVGCQRCELACVEYNEGRSQPSLARIKIARSLNFGPGGPGGAQGAWGNGLVVQGVCRQCPHPVPCASACPNDAIRLDPATGARVVDGQACVGCKLCQRSCPWNMLVFDEETQKTTKCFLCGGSPKCVEACPADALRYVPWRDTTREAPARAASLALITSEKTASCLECHVPGRIGAASK
ncbi:4Fe-4S dicluster domain-containing protein [Fundidesulfovibrio soli]|uniref:4Fe-4S dicluster domain-containing protein n=1 Tax=Fundidesulfovibrio soli TaxID=2922716 RepID=UPI001FAEABBD|nr:4Fe-4S dicluster domain-containing protein [Fundidesulfovibrio soli]